MRRDYQAAARGVSEIGGPEDRCHAARWALAAAAECGEGGAECQKGDRAGLGDWAEGEADHVVSGGGVWADKRGCAGVEIQFVELIGEGVDSESGAVFGTGGDVEDGLGCDGGDQAAGAEGGVDQQELMSIVGDA